MITNKKATPRATRQGAQATETKTALHLVQPAPSTLPFSSAHALFAMPEQLGLTQKEFCQVFGLHYGDYRKLKCGRSEMGIDHFTNMMSALSQVNTLMKKAGRPHGVSYSMHPAKSLTALQKKRAACEAQWQKWSERHHALKEKCASVAMGANVLAAAQTRRTDAQAWDLLRRKLQMRLGQLQAKLHTTEEHLAQLDHRLARYRREEKELQ